MLLFYPFPGLQADPTFVRTMGAVVTVFGIVRLVLFIRQQKKMRLQELEEHNEEE